MRATHAYGYDVVLAIDPTTYEVTRTGDGVGYAFTMDEEARHRLTAAIEGALERPDVEPEVA